MVALLIRIAAAAEPAVPLPGGSPGGNATAMTDIHDIKPALEMGMDLRWLYWTAGIAALLAAAYLAWRMWRRYRQPPAEVAEAEPPADAQAFERLEALAADAAVDAKAFYFKLSAIVRVYIERRFDFPAAEMTTEELLPRLDRLQLGPELAEPLKAFCRYADPVKFAGVPASPDRMTDDLAFARFFVSETSRVTGAAPAAGSGQSGSNIRQQEQPRLPRPETEASENGSK